MIVLRAHSGRLEVENGQGTVQFFLAALWARPVAQGANTEHTRSSIAWDIVYGEESVMPGTVLAEYRGLVYLRAKSNKLMALKIGSVNVAAGYIVEYANPLLLPLAVNASRLADRVIPPW